MNKHDFSRINIEINNTVNGYPNTRKTRATKKNRKLSEKACRIFALMGGQPGIKRLVLMDQCPIANNDLKKCYKELEIFGLIERTNRGLLLTDLGEATYNCSAKKELDKHVNTKKEAVNRPTHYSGGDNPYKVIKVIEVIEVIEAWNLGFHLGNSAKYIFRAGFKDPTRELEDLKKAQWYLNRKIEQLKVKKYHEINIEKELEMKKEEELEMERRMRIERGID